MPFHRIPVARFWQSAFVIAIFIMPFSTHAETSCGAIAAFLDVCKAAREAGSDAAQKVVEASRNLPLMTNQFGLLVDEYYSTDPVKAAHARRLIRGVFPNLPEGISQPNLTFDVSLDAQHIDTRAKILTADITFINTNDPKIFAGELSRGSLYKAERLSGSPTATPATQAAVRTKIKSQLDKWLASGIPPFVLPGGMGTCINQRSQDSASTLQCLLALHDDQLADAIMLLATEGIDVPASATVSRAWRGGAYAVVLIPAKEFQDQTELDPTFQLYVRFHVHGDTTQTAKDFATPFEIPMQLMAKQHLPSNDPARPLFNYAVVDLHIRDYLGAVGSPSN